MYNGPPPRSTTTKASGSWKQPDESTSRGGSCEDTMKNAHNWTAKRAVTHATLTRRWSPMHEGFAYSQTLRPQQEEPLSSQAASLPSGAKSLLGRDKPEEAGVTVSFIWETLCGTPYNEAPREGDACPSRAWCTSHESTKALP